MKTRRKILTITGIVLLAGGIAAGFVLAQDSEEGASSAATASTGSDTFLGRVASILGVEESALVDAFQQARLEQIDAAVAAGRLTQDQADAIRANIEARTALRSVIEDAIASGRLTQEQADLLELHSLGGGLPGRGGVGSQGGMQGGSLGQRGQAAGRFGFVLRTPRGMMGGGIWGRCP